MSEGPKPPARLSRRRFVAVLAAGSAALLAQPAVAAAAAPPAAKPKPASSPKPAAPAMSAAQRKEYDRQKASTLDTLKTIRAHVMPPGTEMASIFRARRPAKKAN